MEALYTAKVLTKDIILIVKYTYSNRAISFNTEYNDADVYTFTFPVVVSFSS